MKLLCTLLAAALLVGCSDQSAQQQAEINRLRADVDRHQQTIANLVDMLDRHFTRSAREFKELEKMASGSFAEREHYDKTISTVLLEVLDRVDTLEQRTNYVVVPKLPPPYSGTPRIRTAPEPKEGGGFIRPALQDGIPDDVYARIELAAAKEWPGNFNMQEYEVKKQVAAWKRLNP